MDYINFSLDILKKINFNIKGRLFLFKKMGESKMLKWSFFWMLYVVMKLCVLKFGFFFKIW